jgi:hypothetical protein
MLAYAAAAERPACDMPLMAHPSRMCPVQKVTGTSNPLNPDAAVVAMAAAIGILAFS